MGSIIGLNFCSASLALLKVHLHTEMYDTWFVYFINLLACGHQNLLRYRFSKVAVSSHYTGALMAIQCSREDY